MAMTRPCDCIIYDVYRVKNSLLDRRTCEIEVNLQKYPVGVYTIYYIVYVGVIKWRQNGRFI